ncbi:two-component sensor histidine kinase [Erythrobacter lutimaris]|nr:histidine kinase [Alteriqipengyuania lutimaris]MBB3034462.1 two-component sensor histidine kinase [Alteriqipengyuania lutimaris]
MTQDQPDRADPAESSRLPLRLVLISIAGLWLTYFVLITVRGLIVGLELQEALLWRRLMVCLAGGGITFGMWLVLRLVDSCSLAVKTATALVVALPAALMIAQTNQMVFADVQEQMIQKIGEQQGVIFRRDEAGNLLVDIPPVPTPAETPDAQTLEDDDLDTRTFVIAPAPIGIERWRQLTDIAIGRYFLLLAWAALYLALLAGAQARASQAREERFRLAAKAAELRSLRYQINPHFLFNTLNSLSSLVITGKDTRAEAMIQAVSNFYRHSLAEEPTEDVALEDEIALQRDYLAIEEVRFPRRLLATIDLPQHLERARVPGMILQPLVENSVRYAVARSTTPVNVTIEAFARDKRLHLVVADDGPGLGDSGGGGFGIGLTNVRDRLRARFGDRAEVLSGQAEGGGYRTELIMPLDVNDGK